MFQSDARHIIQALVGLCALATTVLSVPTPALARDTVVLDQAQIMLGSGLTIRSGATQTITVGHSGLLVRVDIPLCVSIKRSTVKLTVIGKQTARHTGRTSATLTFNRSLEECTWDVFHLTHPLSVRSGEVVRLQLDRVRGPAPLWGAYAHQGNPYPGGVGHWLHYTIKSFGFRTYVKLTGLHS